MEKKKMKKKKKMKNESKLHAQEKIIRARQTLLCLMSQSLSYCARVAGGGSHRGLDVPMHVAVLCRKEKRREKKKERRSQLQNK